MLFFYLFFFDNKKFDGVENNIDYLSNMQSTNKVEISKPIFKSKGLNSNPYEISAKKGIQLGDDLKLIEINGKLTNDKNEKIFLKADTGFYSDKKQKIELDGNVIISDEFGSITSADNALIDIKTEMIDLKGNVFSTRNDIEIRSNFSSLDDKNKILTYSGEVRIIRKINNQYEKVSGNIAKYDLSKEKIKVTGDVTVIKNENVLKGHDLIVDLINSTSIMNSNENNRVLLKIAN